uniref:Adult beta-globin n=1 Tax=Hynobius retardatus TaxID=36312 RepID=Q9PVL7_HYNRE|nr:adult beta-globin [Hynobius retardatus]
MVFTNDERKDIHEVWGKVKADKLGADALARVLIVNPWTRKHFSSFGDLSTPEAILHNPKIAAHGAKVVHSIIEASKHLDDLKGYYADLSNVHCLKLHVDPNNFHLLAGIIVVMLGITLREDFTPHRQASVEKYLEAVCDALSHGYH